MVFILGPVAICCGYVFVVVMLCSYISGVLPVVCCLLLDVALKSELCSVHVPVDQCMPS